MNISNKNYLYKITPFGDDFIIHYLKSNNQMSSFKNQFKGLLPIILILHVILFFVVWYLASIIIRPLKKLAFKSKNLDVSDLKNISKTKSNIAEFSKVFYTFHKALNLLKTNQKKFEKLNSVDLLTKTYNRTKLDKLLNNSFEDFIRYKHLFGVIIIDIDQLKNVNDTYGEQAGNKVLTEFSSIISQNIRRSDIFGRWSGDEFLIICQEINIEDLRKLANKLNNSIQKHYFTAIGHKTASFGVSICYNQDSKERILARAYAALYAAKNNGKNRVEVG